MSNHRQGLWIGAATIALLSASGARAQTATPAPAAATPPEIVVTADRVGLLERKPSTTVLGLSKPLIDTPRSASAVSALTIQRYGVQTINDLVDVSPNSYTASFYGVPGELNIRGTFAENYFLGFKLIENKGTYTTPIGDAAQIDVVRGPPTPVDGPGKVGGFLNFIPKSAASENLTAPEAEVDVTVGAYDKQNITAQVGAPLKLGAARGGLYAYGEADDSGSFYDGIHPRHQLGELSVTYDLPDAWTVSANLMYLHSDGDVQTPGWNRLTQQLVDHGTYITGQNTSLTASPGAGYLTPNQASPGAYSPYPYNYTSVGAGLYAAYGAPLSALPSAFSLNSPGAGTTVKLSPRDVYISPQDFSKTSTPTLVLGASKALGPDNTLDLQLFYNGLENQRFVSYGFPAWFRANVLEARATDDVKLTAPGGLVTADTIVGVSYRHYQGRDMQSYDSGLIALDRRDLSVGATPTDTICDPFVLGIGGDQVPSNCLGWETDVHSRQADEGVFVTTDITVAKRLDLVLGGRYDAYQVTSSDTGIFANYDYPTGVAAGTRESASKGAATYTGALSYKLGLGLTPYVTYDHDNAVEMQQAGDITPGQVLSGFLSQSDLYEGGIKFQELKNTLVGSIDAYKQDRAALAGLNNVSQRTRSTGVELEIRYLLTKNISFTFTGDIQHTEVLGPDTSDAYIPAYAACGSNLACELGSWGGAYFVYSVSSLPGRSGNYSLSSEPHSVASLYGNYVSDEHDWGRGGVTLGVTHVAKTSGVIENAIVYPDYALVNLSAFIDHGKDEVALNIDNLFDKFYVTPDSDPTYVNVAALPGVGREWRLTFKHRF
jgi:iron complex outermembrane receptor protein